MSFTFGSLFSGIGGLDLGLERSGMECKWQVEIDDYATRVLERHWPAVRRLRDVHDVSRSTVEAVDAICGGFPCQPVSSAGKRKAQSDSRWLWPVFASVVDELRPRIAIVENVPGLLESSAGAEVVTDLAALGYDAEWGVFPASAFGAPHKRYRVFILAYPNGHGFPKGDVSSCIIGESPPKTSSSWCGKQQKPQRGFSGRVWRMPDPGFFGMDDGAANKVDRLRVIGNAVVPQVAQWIGEQIMKSGK